MIIVLKHVISCKKNQDLIKLLFSWNITFEKSYKTAIKTPDMPAQHHFSLITDLLLYLLVKLTLAASCLVELNA